MNEGYGTDLEAEGEWSRGGGGCESDRLLDRLFRLKKKMRDLV